MGLVPRTALHYFCPRLAAALGERLRSCSSTSQQPLAGPPSSLEPPALPLAAEVGEEQQQQQSTGGPPARTACSPALAASGSAWRTT